jgi:hypothetical protein
MSIRSLTPSFALSVPLRLYARFLLSRSPILTPPYTRFATFVPLLAITLGCGTTPSGPPLVPAEGLVILDDKPLSGATITFIPQGETAGQAGVGTSDANGRFALSTPDLATPGVAVGTYRVLISKKINPDGTDFRPSPDQDPMLAAYKELLPPIYHDEAKSVLQAEVPAEGTKTLEFKLRSKAP